MNKNDWQLTPVANHDPRLILVMADRDPETGKMEIEEQPITGWLVITDLEKWHTSSQPITMVEPGDDQYVIVYNVETEDWYEPTLNCCIGKGREKMMEYLQELNGGLRVVK